MPRLGPMPIDEAIDKLLSRIELVSSFGACWIWTGKPNENGYGIFGGYARGGSRKAHRRAYEMAIGPIPAGLTIDHLCERRLCVNPLHMKVATVWENVARSRAASALNAAKTHCKRGHELAGDNVRVRVIRGRTSRQCRICDLAGKEEVRRRRGVPPRYPQDQRV